MKINYTVKNRIEIESYILGSIMIMQNNHKDVKDIMFSHGYIDKECFYTELHQDIYQSILKCWENNIAADVVSVTKLKSAKYFRPLNFELSFDFIVIQYTQLISSSAHLEYHLFILKQYIYCDYWNKIAYEILDNSWDDIDVLEFSEKLFITYKDLENKYTGNLKKINNENITEVLKERWEKTKSGQSITVPFSIKKIDEFTGGFYPGELTIFAARPGMGKTTIALIISRKAAIIHKKKVVFFSLEADYIRLIGRIACNHLGIDYKSFRLNTINYEELNAIIQWIENFLLENNLIIIDNCRTLNSIYLKIKELNPDMVFIDYLQLIELDPTSIKKKISNREQEISQISRGLKEIALEFKIPINALSQLSRNVESRTNKMPQLSDLRESGAIEQDADNVIFLLREAYYKEQRKEYVPEYETGNLDISIAKGREWGLKMFKANIDFKTNELLDDYLYGNEFIVPDPPKK